LNPGLKPHFKIGERIFKAGDKLMQISNNYEKNVFNGDMGRLAHINFREKKFIVMFDSNQSVEYNMFEADQLSLAYAVTVHKAQGSEFPAVIMPLLSQHYMMLQRNLLYTGMTRAKKLLILIGDRRSVAMAVNNIRQAPRFTHLREFMIEKQQQITRLHITALR
jgi:exodeoxyribonuclease V alpha subunit